MSADSYVNTVIRALDDLDVGAVKTVATMLRAVRARGSTILVAGNGGSAATASHMVTDLMFGRGLPEPGLRVVGLIDNQSVVTATGNDVSFDEVFARQVRRLGRPGDLLVLISASGNSTNVIRAAEEARLLGVTVVALTGFDGGQLLDLSDIAIHVPTESGAYGPVEDAHLVVCHMLVHLLAVSEGN